MKKDVYRCSACDELKNAKTNIIYKAWDAFKKPSQCSVVGICRKCSNGMKKVNASRVQQYIVMMGGE
jgi:hypothetical protein